MLSRRLLLASLTSSALVLSMAAPTLAHAQDKVIKVGTLKLIHGITPYFYEQFTPAGYKIEVVPFETPTDGKNAVVTKSVDFGSFQELKGKRVGILPGSTQEAVFNDRLKAEGMTIKDVKSVRVSFSEMAGALERGDVDAFVGAEPGPSITVLRNVGKVLEYPYSTPTGSVNMVMTTHADTAKKDPELVKVFLEVHRKASEHAMANRAELVQMAGAKLGFPADVANLAADNVELTWKIDEDWITRSKYYGSLMLERKQIRKLPDYSKFIVTDLNPQR